MLVCFLAKLFVHALGQPDGDDPGGLFRIGAGAAAFTEIVQPSNDLAVLCGSLELRTLLWCIEDPTHDAAVAKGCSVELDPALGNGVLLLGLFENSLRTN